MRIAVINHQGDLGAGAEHALLQFLVRLPATIEPVFFFFEDGAFADEVRRRFDSVTIVPMSQRIAGAQRTCLPLGAVADSARLALRLSKALRAAAPDLVLTNSMKAHVIGSLAAKFAGLPCINYVHDIVSGPARTLLRAVSASCAVERLTCSKAVGASLDLPKTTAVYAPIEVARYENLPQRADARAALGIPNDGVPVVALVGRIARWKGQDAFVRIAQTVLRETDAHFIIVGSPIFGCDAQFVPELEAAIAAGAGAHRIRFVPWQSDMQNVYGAIDLACNCSLQEPFGRTSLEALAAGVPVVCFDDAGVCEIFPQNHGGTYVAAGDEPAFARVICAYLNDGQRMQHAKHAARLAAKPLDIANVYRSFADVLQRVGTARSAASKRRTDMPMAPARTSAPH